MSAIVVPNRAGFEISGGMDSSILPLFMAKYGVHYPIIGASKVVPGKEQTYHLHKLSALEQATSLRTKRILMDPYTDYPLDFMIKTGHYRPIYEIRELYEKTTIDMAKHFLGDNLNVVVSGAGGDQLLENVPNPGRKGGSVQATLCCSSSRSN